MQICRRTFLKAAGAWLVAARPPAVRGNAGAKKPNIILCMADDQGWGDMAYNGHAVLKTPHFDAMAAAALRFDRFYAAAPVCSPTRGSVMTGRHPNRFGCFKWGHPLRPQEITVAEALKTAGYVTGHFGKWHLGSVVEGSPVNPGASGFDEWLSAPNFFDNDPILSREGTAVPTKGESSMVTADAAIEFIRKHARSRQPFFAVVWFGSPHGPHQAIEADRALYKNQSERLQNFYGEITGMDRAFGKLRRELRQLGIRENTLLWYCSDNGGLPRVGRPGYPGVARPHRRPPRHERPVQYLGYLSHAPGHRGRAHEEPAAVRRDQPGRPAGGQNEIAPQADGLLGPPHRRHQHAEQEMDGQPLRGPAGGQEGGRSIASAPGRRQDHETVS